MADITIEEVKQDLETAAYVERLLPPVRAPKYRNCMPDIIYTPQELIFMEKRPLKIRPTQEQITLWERVVLKWLPVLSLDERRLVWKRANRIPWKLLCREYGVSRQMLAIRYDKAIIKIQYGCKKCQ
ncbi:MAG: helix-turn-helix domain-containing protein [Alphaproteobacteria bacterium]|nr:helix-turn-helix domain-containing protein [Alphaproteobacteria bacterium]MBP3514900.1 helix-turn-helix domain-containing protein [Alphaproteobacteria bacterium]